VAAVSSNIWPGVCQLLLYMSVMMSALSSRTT